jgi:hypothetical protein
MKQNRETKDKQQEIGEVSVRDEERAHWRRVVAQDRRWSRQEFTVEDERWLPATLEEEKYGNF